MNKSELPETLYIPSLQLPQGFIDFQIDHEDRIVLLAWRDGATAAKWLESGGLDLHKQRDSAFAHNLSIAPNKVVVRIVEKKDYLKFLSIMSDMPGVQKRSIHFEPDFGSLFRRPIVRLLSNDFVANCRNSSVPVERGRSRRQSQEGER